MIKLKKIILLLGINLLGIIIIACSSNPPSSFTVKINGIDKTVSGKFIEIITKREQNTVKMAYPAVTPNYVIIYSGENIKVYDYEGNKLVRNKTDWYSITNNEYNIIKNVAK